MRGRRAETVCGSWRHEATSSFDEFIFVRSGARFKEESLEVQFLNFTLASKQITHTKIKIHTYIICTYPGIALVSSLILIWEALLYVAFAEKWGALPPTVCGLLLTPNTGDEGADRGFCGESPVLHGKRGVSI